MPVEMIQNGKTGVQCGNLLEQLLCYSQLSHYNTYQINHNNQKFYSAQAGEHTPKIVYVCILPVNFFIMAEHRRHRRPSLLRRILRFFGLAPQRHSTHHHRQGQSTGQVSDVHQISPYALSQSSDRPPLPTPVPETKPHRHHRRHRRFRPRIKSGGGLFSFKSKHRSRPKPEPGEKMTFATALTWMRTELPGYLLKLANSMGLFMAAYVIVWFTYSFSVIFIASFFNIHAVLTYFEVMWTIDNASPLWNDLNIVAITFAGPFVSLLMGLVYYAILRIKKQMGTQLRTLVFWLFVLSMAHFLGAFVAGAITWQGFGYVIAWVNMHIFFRILISLIFLAAMAWIGWLHAGAMLDTRTLRVHSKDIPYILINRMVLPYLLGTILLIILKIPNVAPQHPTIWDYDVMIIASVLFAVVPPLFNKKLKAPSRSLKHLSHRRRRIFAYGAIAASVAVLLLYRLGLSDGLYVFMKFVVNVTPYK